MRKTRRRASRRKCGFKPVKVGDHYQWAPDWEERAIMAEITRLRDAEGWSFEAISDSIEQRICQSDGRQFRDSAFFKRKWSPSKCRRAYFAYKRILEEEGLTSK
jgi:hypothetical protein